MMRLRKIEYASMTRIAGICGILLPIVVFTSIVLALSRSPWFDWTHHALSDMGVETVTASIFNNGMVLGGILIFVFSLGMMKSLSNKTGPCLLCISSFALIGIGVFPEYEEIFIIHFITSASFFVLLTISLLVIGLQIKQDPSKRSIGTLAIIFAAIAICSIVFLVPFECIAISEVLAFFPASLWCMIYGVKMTLA